MGIREIANAAIDAEKAEQEAAKKRNWRENAKAGEQIVSELLGITGKAIRARKVAPSEDGTGSLWGDDTVVELEEGVYVSVRNTRYHRQDRWGAYSKTEETCYLRITNAEGHSAKCADDSSFDSPRITTLAELGKALADFDAQPEKNRLEAEKRAAWRAERDARKAKATA